MKNLCKEIQAPVQARKGACSMGSVFITETRVFGIIEKINEKSIRVKLNRLVVERTGKAREIIRDDDLNKSVSFKFWKITDDGRELFYNSDFQTILEF